jgi:hypothetical protein
MRNFLLGVAAAITIVSAAEAGPLQDGVYRSGDAAVIQTVQFAWGGRDYCWYDHGWHGPGWYWCGYGLRRGFGWGGGFGWHGWSHEGFHGGHGGFHGGHGNFHGGGHGGGGSHGGGQGGSGHHH